MITNSRPLYAWPSILLELAILTGRPRGLVGEAWIELHHRAREAADEAIAGCANESGPYRVAPPPGMH